MLNDEAGQPTKPSFKPTTATPIYNLLTHQQGVWTKERIRQYYPLYQGIDNGIQSSSYFSSASSFDTPKPFQSLTMNSLYQEIVNRLQHLTHTYNNSPYLTQQKKSTHNRTTFLNDSTSSSSNFTTSNILFASSPNPSYHDYTFNNNNNPIQNIINTNINHLRPPVIPTVTTRLHTLKTPEFININSLSPPTPNDHPTNSKPPPDYQSDSSSDDDYFLCNKEEHQRNLPFGDLITIQKDNDHTRLIFQNVNSLELSSGHHTLELMCDNIWQNKVDIACLAETNNNWKHPHGEVLFKATKKRHWRHSHSTTSEQELIGMTYINQEAMQYLLFHHSSPVSPPQAVTPTD